MTILIETLLVSLSMQHAQGYYLINAQTGQLKLNYSLNTMIKHIQNCTFTQEILDCKIHF